MIMRHEDIVKKAPVSRIFNIRSKGKFLFWLIFIMIIIGWSMQQTGVNPKVFIGGMPRMMDFLSLAFPPDFSKLPEYLSLMIETIHIGLWATFLAVCLSIPMGLMAARNTTPGKVFRFTARTILDFFRSIPDLIKAVIFVVAVGMGPFAGLLALTLHGASLLGKFYADEIEAVNPGPVEALQATGAGRIQTILFAIIPQALPTGIAYTLYILDHSIRMATVLGVVGAGGIGLALILSMRLFEYDETMAIIIIIFVTVSLLDKISTYLRKRII